SHTSPRYCINGGAISAPTVTNVDVPYEDLIDLLGKRLSLEECVDRITFMGAGPEGVQDGTMTFDIFANRPDLYSVEGIARALHVQGGPPAGGPLHAVRPGRGHGPAGHPREARKGAGVRPPGRLATGLPDHHGCEGERVEFPTRHQRSPDPAHTRHAKRVHRCHGDGPR